MNLNDLVICAYPLYETYHAIKRPRNPVLKHWLTFWCLFMGFKMIEYFTWNLVPFLGLIKNTVLFSCWNRHVGAIIFSTISIWVRHLDRETRRSEFWSPIRQDLDEVLNRSYQFFTQEVLPKITQYIAAQRLRRY